MKVLTDLAAAARTRSFGLPRGTHHKCPSLAASLKARPGIIAEIKPGSPTEGEMRRVQDVEALARSLLGAGASGISALTEPTRFGGSDMLLADACRAGGPTLMKDFVVTERQLQLASSWGASAVLLILPLLTKEHSEWASPEEAIAAAHTLKLDVLLEVYDDEEFLLASLLEPDMIGINDRDLRDDALPVDPERAIGVLGRCGPVDVPVVALSGVHDAGGIRARIRAGARGVLVGTALMKASDPVARLKELLEGLK